MHSYNSKYSSRLPNFQLVISREIACRSFFVLTNRPRHYMLSIKFNHITSRIDIVNLIRGPTSEAAMDIKSRRLPSKFHHHHPTLIHTLSLKQLFQSPHFNDQSNFIHSFQNPSQRPSLRPHLHLSSCVSNSHICLLSSPSSQPRQYRPPARTPNC